MRFVRVSRENNDKKMTPKFDKKRAAVTQVTADEKKSRKIDDLLWRFQKKLQFKKYRKNYDLLGQLSQKIENSMFRFCTLLALGSTNAPVVLRISPYSKPPRNSRTTCPHGPLYSNDSRVLDLRFFSFIPNVYVI